MVDHMALIDGFFWWVWRLQKLQDANGLFALLFEAVTLKSGYILYRFIDLFQRITRFRRK